MPAQDVNLLYNDQVARQWANRIAEAFKDGGNSYGKAAESIGKAMENAAESTEDVSKAQKEARLLIKHLAQLTFYMRGGVRYDDLLLNRTRAEREIMEEVIEENIKSQKGAMNLVY